MAANACIVGVQASNQYAEITTGLPALGGPYTIFGWIYHSATGIFNSHWALSNAGTTVGSDFLTNTSNLSDIYNFTSGLLGASIAGSTWLCFALVRTSTTQENLYRADGSGVFTSDISNTKSTSGTAARLWLMRTTDAARDLSGRMAFCRVWTQALTPTELAAEWARTTAQRTADLWADYPLQTDANDISGNARHLTLFGSPSFGDTAMGPTVPDAGGGGGGSSDPFVTIQFTGA